MTTMYAIRDPALPIMLVGLSIAVLMLIIMLAGWYYQTHKKDE